MNAPQTHTHTDSYTLIFTYTHMNALHAHTLTYVNALQVRTHTPMHTQTHTHSHAHSHIYTHIYTLTCTYVYSHTLIHVQHTHLVTHTRVQK